MTNEQKKILIAEDDPFLSKVLGSILLEEGFAITKAADGAKALENIKNNNYTLILLDLIMPVKSGFEVLEALKKDNVKTPVLVFSNLSQEKDKEECLALGAKDYFIKSNISINDVIEAVKKYAK